MRTYFTICLLLLAFWGCAQPAPPLPSDSQSSTSFADGPTVPRPAPSDLNAAGDEHGHKPGAHGGIMVSVGSDSYHAEAVFENGGKLRLYTLGQDESRVIDVDLQSVKAYVKGEGNADSEVVMLEPEPQEGDASGRTSQFVGLLPESLMGRSVEVTIPNFVISGERFRIGFSSISASHEEEMPDRIADDEERELYLTPGGIYTEADIAANGGVTATVKFRGIKSSHDMFPESGDRICPITKTKANPQFAWIVAEKSYQFCCPPCVDEFVKAAKANSPDILEPDAYIKP